MSDATWPLKAEHEYLAAKFNDKLENCVNSYSTSQVELEACTSECGLNDLSYASMFLVSGTDAPRFVSTLFAGSILQVGECAFEPLLTGTGDVIGIPWVMRAGDFEYLVFEPTQRGEVVKSWLEAMADLSQDANCVFPDLVIEDKTNALYPMVLCGPKAPQILSDYTKGEDVAFKPSTIVSCTLDETPALVSSYEVSSIPCYLLLIPPVMARVFWRSFLSFKEVSPVGAIALREFCAIQLGKWFDQLQTESKVHLKPQELIECGLIRRDLDFVGARSLD